MFCVNSLRIVCSSRAAVHPRWLTTNRLCVSKAVTCMSTSCHNKDTWDSKTNFRGQERELFNYTKQLSTTRKCSTSQVKLNCWNCKQLLERTPAFFCMSCNVVQPPEESTSFFKLMDCDHTFTVDTQKLQKRYLQLQRSLHPDNFSQKSAKEQEYSDSQSALVNKAYNTLLKPLSRGLYMLELEGMRIEEGTDPGADSDFLMELMEINEALDEAQTAEAAERIGQDTKGKLADLTEQIDTTLRKGELEAAKALLVQMKYYSNIEEKVKEKLSEFM